MKLIGVDWQTHSEPERLKLKQHWKELRSYFATVLVVY